MPTAIDPQPLIDDAKCYSCSIPEGMVWYAVLAALSDLANGETVPSSAEDLMSEARCLYCAIPQGMVPYAILAAASQITSGGGGGGGQIKEYTADPNTEVVVPDDITLPAVAYQEDGTGPTFSWNTTTHVWQ